MSRHLILLLGKGGVGKSVLAQATARTLAHAGHRTLLCHVLDVEPKEQKLVELSPNLHEITLNSSECFKEYIHLKLPVKGLASFLLGNKVMQYLEKAAPGVRELVLLGKMWHSRKNYDRVVVDMPSTGYALTMLHTPFNFTTLIPGGPVFHDAQNMLATFSDPKQTALVTVCLPEEMPIQESLELDEKLKHLMPTNPSWLVLNRILQLDEKIKTVDIPDGALGKAAELRLTKWHEQQKKIETLKSAWKNAEWIDLPELAEATDVGVTHAMQAQLEGLAK